MPNTRWWTELGGGALAGAAAWLFFAQREPMQVLVGMNAIDARVPPHYQASAFPAFAALALATLGDRRQPDLRRRRLALLAASGAVALVRLDGRLPLSGHAVFLAAAAAFEAASASPEGRRMRLALALGGLGVTAFYKLAVWRDPTWFGVSALVGAVSGAALSAR